MVLVKAKAVSVDSLVVLDSDRISILRHLILDNPL